MVPPVVGFNWVLRAAKKITSELEAAAVGLLKNGAGPRDGSRGSRPIIPYRRDRSEFR